VRSWASNAILGASRRESLIRVALALALLAAVFWFLPIRRAGEEGGHHGGAPGLDPFERASRHPRSRSPRSTARAHPWPIIATSSSS
jgi:hypothetical protein